MKHLSNWVDPIRCWQLFSGVAGIYISYLATGFLQEKMYIRGNPGFHITIRLSKK